MLNVSNPSGSWKSVKNCFLITIFHLLSEYQHYKTSNG